MTYHHAVVAKLVEQRDFATRECKSTIAELNLMTQELKDLTREMKEQSDAIETHLKTITAQKDTIEELEARISALEKNDPDLSIYEDTMDDDVECDRRNEADMLDTCVVLVLMVALLLIVAIQGKSLSLEEL